MKHTIIFIFLFMFISNLSQAAVLTVINKTPHVIRLFSPTLNGVEVVIIKPEEKREYNSGLADITHLEWEEVVMKDTVTVKSAVRYKASMFVEKTKTGGRFEIYQNGVYNYYMGVDGSGAGTAQRM